MRFFWSRVECEAAVGSNVRSVPFWLVGIWLKLEKLESELWLCGFLLYVFRWKHTYANSKKTEAVLYRLYIYILYIYIYIRFY